MHCVVAWGPPKLPSRHASPRQPLPAPASPGQLLLNVSAINQGAKAEKAECLILSKLILGKKFHIRCFSGLSEEICEMEGSP